MITTEDLFPEVIGVSSSIHKVMDSVHQLMNQSIPLLITGETGTGKELIARAVHLHSTRHDNPFIPVNCSAMPQDLIEMELFGFEKGSFTGAIYSKKGLVEEANEGTLFLDEITELPVSVQSKLLRLLQDREFRKMGDLKTRYSTARFVFATNQNLPEMLNRGTFRSDLYYRIRGAEIHLPPLRERKEDILLLAIYFLKTSTSFRSSKIQGFTDAASEFMLQYPWPGNVRELKFEIERIIAVSEKDMISEDDFDSPLRGLSKTGTGSCFPGTLENLEKSLIEQRIHDFEGNIRQTATSLGISRHALYNRIKKYGLTLDRNRKPKT